MAANLRFNLKAGEILTREDMEGPDNPQRGYKLQQVMRDFGVAVKFDFSTRRLFADVPLAAEISSNMLLWQTEAFRELVQSVSVLDKFTSAAELLPPGVYRDGETCGVLEMEPALTTRFEDQYSLRFGFQYTLFLAGTDLDAVLELHKIIRSRKVKPTEPWCPMREEDTKE